MEIQLNDELAKKVHIAGRIHKVIMSTFLSFIYIVLHIITFSLFYISGTFDSILLQNIVAALISMFIMALGYSAPDLGLVLILGILSIPFGWLEILISRNYALNQKVEAIKYKWKEKDQEEMTTNLEEWLIQHKEDFASILKIEGELSRNQLSNHELRDMISEELRLNIIFSRNAKKGLSEHKELVKDSLEGLPEIIECLKEGNPLEERHISILYRNINTLKAQE